MGLVIGLRFYKVEAHKDGDTTPFNLTRDGSHRDLYKFAEDFLSANITINDRDDLFRSWYFEIKSKLDVNNLYGLIRYGTYGFESNLVDKNTKNQNYKRKTTDLEEIPLYFHLWFPTNADFGIFCVQSFQSRSCVTMVTDAMLKYYNHKFNGSRVSFKKIMPSDLPGNKYFNAPVKKISWVKRVVPSDIADKYTDGLSADKVEYEVSIRAKRNNILGVVKDYLSTNKDDGEAVMLLEGEKFDEVRAEVMIGKKRRTVGLFGYSNDAGTIDVPDDITIGLDGHPTFDSIKRETSALILEFYKTLNAKK